MDMGGPAAAVGEERVSVRRAEDVDSTILEAGRWLRLNFMSSVHIITDQPCMEQLIHHGALTLSIVQAVADSKISNGCGLEIETSVVIEILVNLDVLHEDP